MPPPRTTRTARPAASQDDGWLELTAVRRAAVAGRPVTHRRILVQVGALTLLVLAGVVAVGGWASRQEAESEAVDAAARRTQTLARAVVEPVLTDAVVAGDPGALATLDRAVRDHVLNDAVVRVKIWSADGAVVYSDEPRLVGRQFGLDEEEAEMLSRGSGRGAEVTDLDEPENVYERDRGKLLEVYLPVHTPDGTPLLFETYSPYDSVVTRTGEIWGGFAVITAASLVALFLLLLPLVTSLVRRLRGLQEQRERLLEQALAASDTERRRVAASLHDGPVQELAGTAFVVAGAAQKARDADQPALATALDEAAAAVRSGIGGLRSLLVEVYPATLARTGLTGALADLLGGLAPREVVVTTDIEPAAVEALSAEQAQHVFHVAQELVRNVAKHAAASAARLTLTRSGPLVVLELTDDGVGFDPEAAFAHPDAGHIGLPLLRDAAQQHGTRLAVRSAPGAGAAWRLEVPVP
ncbi:integral membrane sensor signal transduction histidine kinase [Nocardioides anomalus]|uniref:Oxygen sensor histidine kinase NreB n=1 Tax=Nocardioides anomalus TaxID=2712223 RepID=A0A6G6WH22_9ACTN|nr:ATP-binding protein [Nocardioides anomalus]QIG44457.1 integral membrane sensor signal transduction histidine kinase [Nocardioides anomalus]